MKSSDKLHAIVKRLERLPTAMASEKAAIAGDLYRLAEEIGKRQDGGAIGKLMEKANQPSPRRRPKPRIIPLEVM